MENIFDRELLERANFTDAEAKECMDLVSTFLSMAEKARREGLLTLEEDVPSLGSLFFKRALDMVVDGWEPEEIQRILYVSICTEHATGVELVKRLLIYEGVLSLQKGENPLVMKRKLEAYLGGKVDLDKYLRD